MITNTKTVIQVPENTAASVKIKVTDPNGDAVLYKMRAVPERGLEYYQIDTKGKQTRCVGETQKGRRHAVWVRHKREADTLCG